MKERRPKSVRIDGERSSSLIEKARGEDCDFFAFEFTEIFKRILTTRKRYRCETVECFEIDSIPIQQALPALAFTVYEVSEVWRQFPIPEAQFDPMFETIGLRSLLISELLDEDPTCQCTKLKLLYFHI